MRVCALWLFMISLVQGIRILFENGSRIVYRLSGTGSSGATLRIYLEHYEPASGNLNQSPTDILKPLITLALQLCDLQALTNRTSPTVIT
jgi:phosphoglucomutase